MNIHNYTKLNVYLHRSVMPHTYRWTHCTTNRFAPQLLIFEFLVQKLNVEEKCFFGFFTFSHRAFRYGVAVIMKVVRHSIFPGPMAPNVDLAIGVNMANAYHGIDKL